MARQSISDGALRYEVRWLKRGDEAGAWRILTSTDKLPEARAWRDQWKKSSTCAEVMIFDRLKSERVWS